MSAEPTQPETNQAAQEVASEPTLEQRVDALIETIEKAQTVIELGQALLVMEDLDIVTESEACSVAKMIGQRLNQVLEFRTVSKEREAVYTMIVGILGMVILTKRIETLQRAIDNPFADDLEE